jgi:hypothetical protein
MRAQAGYEIGFLLFALFYYAFVTWAAASWPSSTGTVSGALVIPTLPTAPNILDYLVWALSMAWFYISAFWAFHINIPVLVFISLTITLGVGYVILKLIRGG